MSEREKERLAGLLHETYGLVGDAVMEDAQKSEPPPFTAFYSRLADALLARGVRLPGEGPEGLRAQLRDGAAAYIEDDPHAWSAWVDVVREYGSQFGAMATHLGTDAGAAEVLGGTILAVLADVYDIFLTRGARLRALPGEDETPRTDRCTFLVRGPDTTPADIHECGRAAAEHPVTGYGRFENHANMLEER